MIRELKDKRDPEFLEFWNTQHPLPVHKTGLDADSPMHRVYIEKNEAGAIVSCCLFVAVVEDGFFLGHTCYLASEYRNKCLLRFCRETMKELVYHPGFEWINVETRNNPNLRNIEKLVTHLGFQPVLVPSHGWTDYLWNSKNLATKKGYELCHQ